MTKTPAELQIELLQRMKAGGAHAGSSLPDEGDTDAGARVAAPKTPRAKRVAGPAKSMNVDAKTWGRLEQRRRAEFKDSRQMAAWAARLLLALPVGVAGLDVEDQEDLFRTMRDWAKGRGLSAQDF